MSIRRWAARVDKTQAPIVEALRMCGFHVELIRSPVDLAVRHPSWPKNRWMFAEAKSPTGKKQTARLRKDQPAQNEFVAKEGIPRWTSPEQALRELYAATNIQTRELPGQGDVSADAVEAHRAGKADARIPVRQQLEPGGSS